MENYKVRVSNESESKEVQDLFEQLGFKKGACSNRCYPYLIIAHDGYSSKCGDLNSFHRYVELTIDHLRDLSANQKTIGKVSYLVKTIDKWEEQELTSDTPESETCLKIPDWGNSAHVHNDSVHFLFAVTICEKTVWKRQPETMLTPTHPEELPFIDDEPKMTDIEQTLNERQSQYGDFSEVAETTQSMYLMLLNDDMTDVEREALHMICSKLSRIKHGDCHKIDSWHDIAGYATLVVKDLEQNNG